MWDTIVLGGNLQTDSEPFVGDVFLLIWEHLPKIASTTTGRETGSTPGWEPLLIPVSQPGVRIRD